VVLMLSRPPAHETEGNENLIRLDIAKQRNGPTGKIELLFDRNIQRFKSVMPGGEAAAHGAPSAEEASYDAEDIYTDDDTPF